jgi:hypothetical protein
MSFETHSVTMTLLFFFFFFALCVCVLCVCVCVYRGALDLALCMQLRFHHKHRRSNIIRKVLQNARANAINTYNMDPTRLYIGTVWH